MMNEQLLRLERLVTALIRMEGMRAENQQREHLGMSIAYGEESFDKIVEEIEQC